ncbi:MAG TPA: 2-phosphosulfolactate phosphatase, partial [Porphyromonadaceae bacterium]|nr:2-phosphosulfolactate phosphatase [Porphyromonadaceae bacterium]
SAYLLIGAFSNIDVLMEKSIELGGRVVILCAGWNNRINIEDTLFAGAFAEKLIQKAVIRRLPDSVRIALHLWEKAKSDPLEFVKR